MAQLEKRGPGGPGRLGGACTATRGRSEAGQSGRLRALSGAAVLAAVLAAGCRGPLSPSRQEPLIDTVIGAAGGSRGAGDGGPAIRAELIDPNSVAVGAGDVVYIADGRSHRVRRVDVAGRITTVAGGGAGLLGSGGAAGAVLYGPSGLALDAAGNLYLSDGNAVRKVAPNGSLSIVAGTGKAGFSGDGGPAAQARLNQPLGLAVGPRGSLYVADYGNQRIRRVTPDGRISTVAGTGARGFSGDGGPALSAELSAPVAVARDARGNLYIADSENERVREVKPSGNITTVAGGGKAYSDGGLANRTALGAPFGLAVDRAGNLYIADHVRHRVRKVSPSGIITTVLGQGEAGYSGDGGPGPRARIDAPSGLATDAAGSLFVADTGNRRIRRLGTDGIVTTIAGGDVADGGPPLAALLSSPTAVVSDAQGSLFVADRDDARVRKVGADHTMLTLAGAGEWGFSGDGGPAVAARLNLPSGLAIDAKGDLLIADTGNQRIRKVTPAGAITTVAGSGARGFSGDGGPATRAALRDPAGVAVDAAGNVLIADTLNSRVRRVGPGGILSTIAGSDVAGFGGDNGPAARARLLNPLAVAVDRAGNLFVADTGNHRVRKVSPNGIIVTIAGTGKPGFSGDGGPATAARLNSPAGLALGPRGSLYVADRDNNRIRRIATDGTISTVAGSGESGYSGDRHPALQAQLAGPTGVFVDARGNLFIADTGNNCIREVGAGVSPLAMP